MIRPAFRLSRLLIAAFAMIAFASCGEGPATEPFVYTQQFIQDASPAGYAGASDTYVNAGNPDTRYDTLPNLFIGTNSGACSAVWMSELYIIPYDAKVVSAELVFYISTSPRSDIRLKSTAIVDMSWGEPLTYNNVATFPLGAAAGSATVASGSLGYVKIPLDAALVQSWVSLPYTNRGLLIQEDVSGGASGTYIGLGSRRQPGGSYKPRLIVRYTL